MLLASGEVEEAAIEAQRAVEIDSTDGETWALLAEAKARLGG